MKRILVPCDFSPVAEEAFKFAVQIAKQSEGELHVLYIIDTTFMNGNPTLENSFAFNVSFLREMEKQAETKFKALRDRLAPRTQTVRFTHMIGSLIDDTRKYIQENKIDLVVVGTHKGNGTSSNADRILRKANIPVLVIHDAPQNRIQNIIVPVIADQYTMPLVEELKKVQTFFKAKIHLVWINTPQVFKTDLEAKTELQEFADQYGLNQYSINIRADQNIERGLLDFAKEKGGDLIAMGTHAWKGLTHVFVGSVSEKIVNHTDLPVWTCSMN